MEMDCDIRQRGVDPLEPPFYLNSHQMISGFGGFGRETVVGMLCLVAGGHCFSPAAELQQDPQVFQRMSCPEAAGWDCHLVRMLEESQLEHEGTWCRYNLQADSQDAYWYCCLRLRALSESMQAGVASATAASEDELDAAAVVGRQQR